MDHWQAVWRSRHSRHRAQRRHQYSTLHRRQRPSNSNSISSWFHQIYALRLTHSPLLSMANCVSTYIWTATDEAVHDELPQVTYVPEHSGLGMGLLYILVHRPLVKDHLICRSMRTPVQYTPSVLFFATTMYYNPTTDPTDASQGYVNYRCGEKVLLE